MIKSSKFSFKAISFLLFFKIIASTIVFSEDTLALTFKSPLVNPSSTVTTTFLAQNLTKITKPTTSSTAENINLKIAKLILEYLKVLLWPIIAIYLINLFKSEARQLLKERLINAEILGSKFIFQASSQEAPPANPKAKVEVSQITPAGFFTAEGIRNIVFQSNLLPSNEKAISELLLFNNFKQHTWLIASLSKVLIVLDDENTRNSNQLIQTIMNKENTVPLKFSLDMNTGIVKFGNYKPWWYYSLHIFPTPTTLEESFHKLLTQNS